MKKINRLLKDIRSEINITQQELADILQVSTILISMIEAEQKEVSKSFIKKLADKMEVSSVSLSPYLFIGDDMPKNKSEEIFFSVIDKLQISLIKEKSKNLLKYVDKEI